MYLILQECDILNKEWETKYQSLLKKAQSLQDMINTKDKALEEKNQQLKAVRIAC